MNDKSPEEMFLGIPGYPDDRELLGLPESGPLRSGQVEAALEHRVEQIARHHLAGSGDARRLQAHLESAADRLQAVIALEGRGPLHPSAVRRAAQRMEAQAQAKADTGAIVRPLALQKAGSGLTADDLTDFDRLALAILVVSRGWNATSAKRLAIVASDHGVSVSDLDRVVQGLTQFLAEGDGLRGAMGAVGRDARVTFLAPAREGSLDRAEGAVERVLSRIDMTLRDEIGSESWASRARLTAIFALFALSWVGILAWVFFGTRGDDTGVAATGAAASERAATVDAAEGLRDATRQPAAVADGSTGVRAGGGAAAVNAIPVKYPRAPGFIPTKTPRAVSDAGGRAPAWIGEVEQFARDARSAAGRPSKESIAALARALSEAGDAWPAAGNYRDELVRALGAAAREVRDTDAIRTVLQALPGSARDETQQGMTEWRLSWRRAFGAGCLAALATDRNQPPEAASAAREELRQRKLPVPRGDVRDAFAAGAIAALGADALGLADRLALGTADLEDASRWAEAVDRAAGSPEERNRAALAAIDASLRAPGALDKPGPLVDFLAYAIHILDFTGRGDDPDRVRSALANWIVDANIPPARIWALTSLLDADLGIAWYGPELVLATSAARAERTALAERVIAAFPKVSRTTAGEAVQVDKVKLEEWQKIVASVAALSQQDAADALRRSAIALAALRAARGFELGDAKVAAGAADAATQLLRREEREWTASPTGERAGIPASGVDDGSFASELQAAGRDAARRIGAIRALGARPAAGDLGPVDARAAVTEALRSTNAESRAAMAVVLADRYANGRNVLLALLDILSDGSTLFDAQEFISRIVGSSVAGADWRVEARERIITRIFLLEDSRAHAVDAAGTEIVSNASQLASSYDRASTGAVASVQRPDRALAALADAMREEAHSRFLAEVFPASVDEIERQRDARRSLAQGMLQRMAAETPAVLQYGAMLVAARQPALRSKIGEHLLAAQRARRGAMGAAAQVSIDLEALLKIMNEGFAPAATERSEG